MAPCSATSIRGSRLIPIRYPASVPRETPHTATRNRLNQTVPFNWSREDPKVRSKANSVCRSLVSMEEKSMTPRALATTNARNIRTRSAPHPALTRGWSTLFRTMSEAT